MKVDSHPRLSGIMDSINATRAHGPDTRLPSEFYDDKVIANVDKICTEEWFAGYQESNEYRTLGIGGLIGDLTQRMVEKARRGEGASAAATAGVSGADFKLSLSGCHDTTIFAALNSLGAVDATRDAWPNFTSNVAFELFRRKDSSAASSHQPTTSGTVWPSTEKTWWYRLFTSPTSTPPSPRTPLVDLPLTERNKLNGYFVRLRYNDQPVTLPYCKATGRHLEGDESFCTLEAFKEAADSFTPRSWKQQCRSNLGTVGIPAVAERPPGV